VVRAGAAAAEGDRRLTPDVLSQLREAGLLRMCVPSAYGGPEVDPVSMLEAIETVATADGATGWCVMIGSTTSSMASYLEPSWARELFGDPASVAGGAFAPTGTGTAVQGGHRVSGRWGWGSGTSHCQWITGGTLTDRGEFHLMMFPAAEVEILDTWHSLGLRGTGSNDFAVHDAFVPDGRSVQPLRSARHEPSALGRFPNFSLLAAGVASAVLGIAARALDELVALAQAKTPTLSQKPLREFASAQIDLARAEAGLASARAFLHDEVAQAWAAVSAGDPVAVAQRARIRLACAHAGEASTGAVDLAHRAGGGPPVFDGSVLQRCLRDVHTATAHLMVSHRMFETYGKLRMGVDADTSML